MTSLVWLMLACTVSQRQPTVIPVGRPISYEVQTATPTSIKPNNEAVATTAALSPLTDAPTFTPAPPTSLPAPTDTPTLVVVATEMIAPTDVPTLEATATPVTPKVITATVPPKPAVDGTIDPPLKGGEWDFESSFVLWTNPHGDCSGALVGAGWTAFVEKGQFGSSCMGENKYKGDVQAGVKSQEITFDFIQANSGIWRTIPTKTTHRYKIVAYAKHVRSLAPIQMALGVDFGGGTEWNAPTVQWFPWRNPAEDVWVTTEETVTATGSATTIFIKGYHPNGDQGGKTFIDNISITDLGF